MNQVLSYSLNNNYKNKILPMIYARGMELYKDNRILKINFDFDKINAIVKGTRDYKVTIVLDEDGNFNGTCNCIYAESEKRVCKHMAAVLIYISEYHDKKVIKKGVTNEKIDNELALFVDKINNNRNAGYLSNQIMTTFNMYARGISVSDEHFVDDIYNFCYQLLELKSFLSNYILVNIYNNIQSKLTIFIEDSYNVHKILNLFINSQSKNTIFIDRVLLLILENNHDNTVIEEVIKYAKKSNYQNIPEILISTLIKTTYTYYDNDKALAIFLTYIYYNRNISLVDDIISFIQNDIKDTKMIGVLEKIKNYNINFLSINDILSKLYIKTNQFDKAKPILEHQFSINPSFKLYQDIKNIYHDNPDWSNFKNYLLGCIKDNNIKLEIILDDDNLDNTWSYIQNNYNIVILNKIFKKFDKVKKESLITMYTKAIISSCIKNNYLVEKDLKTALSNFISLSSIDEIQSLFDKLMFIYNNNDNLLIILQRLIYEKGFYNTITLYQSDTMIIDN